MDNKYTIIIPIFNEASSIPRLLSSLSQYHNEGHEIIIVSDGSTDRSNEILENCNFIHLVKFNHNKGKGIAIKEGLCRANKDRIILFDGDLEIHPSLLSKLMILDDKKNITCVFANRLNKKFSLTIWDIGNFFLNSLFNLVNNSNVKDALCCAKSFLKSDIDTSALKSSKFDIDVEISSLLIKKNSNILNVEIPYERRNRRQGKKLGIRDSIYIVNRIFSSF